MIITRSNHRGQCCGERHYNGTVTDIDGNFSIEADPKSVLNISYIGYLSKEIVVGNQKTINVALLEDTKTLDEVVVIGYGTQKKADLTGSVANVSTDDLNTQSNTTIGQALQVRLPVWISFHREVRRAVVLVSWSVVSER